MGITQPFFTIFSTFLPSFAICTPYTVVLENSESVSATNTIFTDTIPTDVNFIGWVEQPVGASDNSGTEITWAGTVTNSDAVTFTFVVTNNKITSGVITNTAEYSHTSSADSNDATFTVKAAEANLAITKKADPKTNVMFQDEITYTVVLENSGAVSATNAIFTDTLPTEVNFIRWVVSPPNTSLVSKEITWTGTVTVGQAVTFTFVVTNNVITRGLVITNTAKYSHTTSANSADATFEVSSCGGSTTPIHDIQGSGTASPEDGNAHSIEGVVVGDFQTSASLRGFFLQEEDTEADTDPTTSEGIFVYDGSSPTVDVNVGDAVRVEGTVDEYYDLTQLTNVSKVEICPQSSVASAATVNLPITNVNNWEWYEGMLINISQTLYASGNYYQGRYGEVDLSVGGRLDNPTNVVEPGTPAISLQGLNDRSRIQLEDGRTSQNPVPPAYIGDGGTLRAGDTIPELTGVLNYAYGAYEVHPTGTLSFTRVNTREATPPSVGTTVKVASFNVLNYFSTLDDSGAICGPTGGMDCRGADNAAEFTRQRDKIIDAIVKMDADVIGLMEIENHATDTALKDLVSGLNNVAGTGTYTYVNTGPIGTDAIKVAFIYKSSVVTADGSAAILDSSVDATFNDQRNRPVLAQTFVQTADGEKFTAAVNHLKSKGSACNDIGDPDTGDGQGNCNLTRKAAATALVNWLATDPTSSNDPDFLIIGDLNSYAKEDPIDAIKAGGYTNLLEALTGPYSYVFSGQAGYLDHALANASLAKLVSGVAIWHINTDEPAALDYNDYNQASLYNSNQYRASDHDPVIVGLNLSGNSSYLPIILKNYP